MRRFEEQYRLNEGDDVLNRENAIHQDVDLRLDAVEQDAEAFRAGNRADIEAILKSLEQTFGTLAAEMRGLLDQTVGGLSADIIVETATRYFLTDARRAAILSDLRGGVDASGDTLAKLLALIVGGAPVGRQSLKAINDAVVANTATLNAITSGADPTLDSFAEALTRFVIDEGQISGLMTMVGNRLRGDADGGYSAAQIAQFQANLGIDGLESDVASAATTDIGAANTQGVRITGTTAITSFGTAAKRVRRIRFAGALTLTHNAASLILPGGSSITTAAGDTCVATSDASGNWRVRNYTRADGTGIRRASAFGGAGTYGDFSSSGSYADYLSVDFVAAGPSVLITSQAGYYHQNANADVEHILVLRSVTGGVADLGFSQSQGITLTNQFGWAGNTNAALSLTGLVPGNTYRAVARLVRNNANGPTQIRNLQIYGITA